MLDMTGVIGDDGDNDDPAEETAAVEETTTTTIPPPRPARRPTWSSRAIPAPEWATTLVDTARSLPPEFGPADLHNIADAGFPLTDGLAVREVLLADLDALRQAAAANGTPIEHPRRVPQLLAAGRALRPAGRGAGRQRGRQPRRPPRPLRAPARHHDRRHDRGRGGRRPVVGRDAPRASGWRPTPTSSASCSATRPTPRSCTCYDYEPWHLRYVGREMAADVIDVRSDAARVPLAAAPRRHHHDHHRLHHDHRRAVEVLNRGRRGGPAREPM